MVSKEPIIATFVNEKVITENTDFARDLYAKSRFGIISRGKVILAPLEVLFLVDREKLIVHDSRKKPITFERLMKRFKRLVPEVWTRYQVFRDLRKRGYIVKTALKFGAEFRVYDKGIKPGEDHAKWVVYPVPEDQRFTWYEFSAKNRVAHSTKKRLLIGIVDNEGDVTYYEIKWMRP
jgi:tRNA-intron endonuclease, archaea type